ncbi:hypothetical protein DU502_01670 [Haloplanus aerogenes]|uniref:Uncharacterized protein n=1 Tax=Haloplanus aerogenes TaxID=660522 RepID=A0A3G8QR34_9EURY|nr:hypothetical protein DU502_01670 [Haloplanus aerogenes]
MTGIGVQYPPATRTERNDDPNETRRGRVRGAAGDRRYGRRGARERARRCRCGRPVRRPRGAGRRERGRRRRERRRRRGQP